MTKQNDYIKRRKEQGMCVWPGCQEKPPVKKSGALATRCRKHLDYYNAKQKEYAKERPIEQDPDAVAQGEQT